MLPKNPHGASLSPGPLRLLETRPRFGQSAENRIVYLITNRAFVSNCADALAVLLVYSDAGAI
jgi:hypothetical protein